ncbi:MAG: polysaccharide biosynthesis protein [Acidobacteriota bacterium]
MRSFELHELLPPRRIATDRAAMKASVEGRRVLVTGAGGSVGSELCRQLATLGCASLTMVERHENSLHDLMLSFESAVADPFLADILDERRLAEAFRKSRPQVVFHAAAHKHVSLAELHARETVRNNVTGTRLVMEAAERHGAEKFVLISTDKAVNPSSVMGATKRVTELLVRAARNSPTIFTTVRFGNVLGSNGSVLPRFLQQIRKGGPLTVTHPEVRRFFILIPEAVQLVIEAAFLAQAGSIYLLDMGESIRIVDLARRVIEVSGAPSSTNIEFIGLRQGEKIDEDLIGDDERAIPTGLAHIAEIRSETPLADSFASDLANLERLASTGTNDDVIARLRAIVPNFVHYLPVHA